MSYSPGDLISYRLFDPETGQITKRVWWGIYLGEGEPRRGTHKGADQRTVRAYWTDLGCRDCVAEWCVWEQS